MSTSFGATGSIPTRGYAVAGEGRLVRRPGPPFWPSPCAQTQWDLPVVLMAPGRPGLDTGARHRTAPRRSRRGGMAAGAPSPEAPFRPYSKPRYSAIGEAVPGTALPIYAPSCPEQQRASRAGQHPEPGAPRAAAPGRHGLGDYPVCAEASSAASGQGNLGGAPRANHMPAAGEPPDPLEN